MSASYKVPGIRRTALNEIPLNHPGISCVVCRRVCFTKLCAGISMGIAGGGDTELDTTLPVRINKPAIMAVDNGAKSADAARSGLLARYPVFFFFVLCFVLTWGYFWLIWAPL